MSAFSSSTINPPGAGSRQSARQTRTNPSRTSKTVGRSSFAFGRGSIAEIPATSSVPHGFYPALTHFTDTITALPREFRRHNSLLKEVDAKAWALEENLLQLLKYSSESQPVPHPPHPASIVNGVIREDVIPKVGYILPMVGGMHTNGCSSTRSSLNSPKCPRVKTAGCSSTASGKVFPI